MDMRLSTLEAVAVDRRDLASNIVDIPDCTNTDLNVKTEIMNRFPLVTWLLQTPLTARTRQEIRDNCITHKDCDGKWVIETPREIWTLEPAEGESEECCWTAPEFAICGGAAPLNLLCLKDCDSIIDELMGQNVLFGRNAEGIASETDTLNEVKRRVARLQMAFYTANTAINGHTNIATNVLKPFRGLAQVMENPVITPIVGTNILMAFESAACRMAILGNDNYVFALNPIVYQGLLSVIRVSQYGQLPAGWTRDGDTIRFQGHGFIQDRLVPVDLADGTGEIWVLNGDAVGLYLATDLQPGDDFIKYSGHKEETRADGCASDCTYYYNIGAVLANNANKLMRIVDVPLSGACMTAIGDLGALIAPQTLIPAV